MTHSPKKTTNKQVIINFRPEKDLFELMQNWLAQHQDIKRSALINMALREFISHPHTLAPAETIMASKREVKGSIKKMLAEHEDTLDKLK